MRQSVSTLLMFFPLFIYPDDTKGYAVALRCSGIFAKLWKRVISDKRIYKINKNMTKASPKLSKSSEIEGFSIVKIA